MKKLMTFLTILLMTITGATAQTGFITGKVIGDKNEPVVGAIVEAIQNGTLIANMQTDREGNYRIKNIRPGRYDVKTTYVGYNDHITKGVIISPNKGTQVDVKLELRSSLALEEIAVTAYKVSPVEKYSPGSSTTRTAEQIEKMPVRSTNSVAATIQGARNQGTIYYIDGVQVLGSVTDKISYNNESYKKEKENDFLDVKGNPLSTMSIDVDRASYSNIRRYIDDGMMPPKDAVRIEEMVNYFNYQYPQPKGKDPLKIVTQLTDCPWKPEHKLLHIGMQARTIPTDNLPPSNLVFLIDVSGSMDEENKLPLAQIALKMLTENLRAQDKIAIVVYAGSAGLVLPATSGADKKAIYEALNRLEAGGSTAGGEGIMLAYKTARENFIRDGNNRVILLTDGDFNVGMSGDNDMERLIETEREKGVYLTCLGFGMGNYKDSKLEVLADKGNGNYAYIDNEQEAKKTLVKEFGGTIYTLAKDVKTQIEFNPLLVQSYRLVGYENRLLNDEDFKDDMKDAGDMGSGHSVTIIYELIPTGVKSAGARKTGGLKYQVSNTTGSKELATIKFRYKKPNGRKSKELAHIIEDKILTMNDAGDDARFATSVAMFGMLLKDSPYKGNSNYNQVISMAKQSIGADEEGYREEFIDLVTEVAESYGMVTDDAGSETIAGWYDEE